MTRRALVSARARTVKWLRRWIRQPFLRERAPHLPSRGTVSVHTLVSSRDLELAICAAKSFILATERTWPWTFHDDGSLSIRDAMRLTRQLPGARVVLRRESDARMARVLEAYPRLSSLRSRACMMLKLLDPSVFAVGPRLLLIDTDVLFFRYPAALLDTLWRGAGVWYNRDVGDAYTATRGQIARATGVSVPERVNAGLLVANRDDVCFELLERWCVRLPLGHPKSMHRIEQTLWALLAGFEESQGGPLPPEYDVTLTEWDRGRPCRHYVGAVRPRLEFEGLRMLLTQDCWLRRWRRLAKGSSR